MITGRARAMGAVSIVNAIAGGRGATISIDLPTSAEVRIQESRGKWVLFKNGTRTRSRLGEESSRRAIKMIGKDPGRFSGSIHTSSSAPPGVGLKTSSSASVAIALAVCDAFSIGRPTQSKILECSASSSLASGTSITGAMDDAASCLLGGKNFVDNRKGRVLSSSKLGKSFGVLVKIPLEKSRRGRVETREVKRFADVADSIFEMGLAGNPWKAMTLNGLMYSSIYGYDPAPAMEALEMGALASGLSGTGPAVAAVFETKDGTEDLARAWEKDGAAVIRTVTCDRGAKVGG